MSLCPSARINALVFEEFKGYSMSFYVTIISQSMMSACFQFSHHLALSYTPICISCMTLCLKLNDCSNRPSFFLLFFLDNFHFMLI